MRTTNKDKVSKDNSKLNQYLFKILANFPTQCSDACLALHREKTSRMSTARFRTMHQRHWSCQWEATLADHITSRQSCQTHKHPLSVTRCL